MKHSEAYDMLIELRGDVKNSQLGPILKPYVDGLIVCMLQYLSQIYVLLPAVIDE